MAHARMAAARGRCCRHQHFAEVINGQLIHELERVAGGPARTAGGGEDGAATLSEPLRLNFHRPQLFKNGNRTMR